MAEMGNDSHLVVAAEDRWSSRDNDLVVMSMTSRWGQLASLQKFGNRHAYLANNAVEQDVGLSLGIARLENLALLT